MAEIMATSVMQSTLLRLLACCVDVDSSGEVAGVCATRGLLRWYGVHAAAVHELHRSSQRVVLKERIDFRTPPGLIGGRFDGRH